MAKYKTTGCARFLIFMVILIPIAYFGAQYLSESGKMDDIRAKVENMTNKESSDSEISSEDIIGSGIDNTEIKSRIEDLLDKIKVQQAIIEDRDETIAKQKEVIDKLLQERAQVQSNTGADQNTQPTSSSDGQPTLEDLLKEADKAIKNN